MFPIVMANIMNFLMILLEFISDGPNVDIYMAAGFILLAISGLATNEN